MTSAKPDIVAIGDAIVDVIATCDEAFLIEHRLPKGSMQFLTPAEADRLYNAMRSAQATSGGSAANTMAGVAAMGGQAAFVGQVAADQFGQIFAHDLRALGVAFDTAPLKQGPPTGRCLILVTPDAQRTMNTCPGASHEIEPAALDGAPVGAARILYLEGYFWGPEKPRAVSKQAMRLAREAGVSVAFTVSDSVCLPAYRDSFVAVLEEGGVDILFANVDEALRLTGAADLDAAVKRLSAKVPTLIVTKGPDGAVAVEGGHRIDQPAVPVQNVVDTTGAGDLFAAGVLTARVKGHSLDRQLMTGAIAAAEIISHFGARPVADLNELVRL